MSFHEEADPYFEDEYEDSEEYFTGVWEDEDCDESDDCPEDEEWEDDLDIDYDETDDLPALYQCEICGGIEDGCTCENRAYIPF